MCFINCKNICVFFLGFLGKFIYIINKMFCIYEIVFVFKVILSVGDNSNVWVIIERKFVLCIWWDYVLVFIIFFLVFLYVNI